MTTEQALILAVGIVVLAAVLAVWYVIRKGRAFASGEVFRASRLSRGNRVFPTQVLITPTSVVHFTPQWIGKLEHTIHIAHVASVRIDTNLLFSDVFIETSGGVSPVVCHGHSKKDAVRMKTLIDRYQTNYYKSPQPSAAPGTVAPPASGR